MWLVIVKYANDLCGEREKKNQRRYNANRPAARKYTHHKNLGTHCWYYRERVWKRSGELVVTVATNCLSSIESQARKFSKRDFVRDPLDTVHDKISPLQNYTYYILATTTDYIASRFFPKWIDFLLRAFNIIVLRLHELNPMNLFVRTRALAYKLYCMPIL